MPPVVSIGLPVYNGAAFLAEALRSILEQSYSDWELIIADDDSSDQSWPIIQQFEDPRIHVYRNVERLGLVENWNCCLSKARGKYVCVFHQDDIMQRENLVRKVAFLDAHSEAGMVYSSALAINSEGHIVDNDQFLVQKDICEDSQAFIERLLFSDRNFVCCPGVVMRHILVEQVGGFNAKLPFTVDIDMWLRLGEQMAVGALADSLIHYRIHAGQESSHYDFGRVQYEEFQAKKDFTRKHSDRSLTKHLRRIYAQRFLRMAYYRQKTKGKRWAWGRLAQGFMLSPRELMGREGFALIRRLLKKRKW